MQGNRHTSRGGIRLPRFRPGHVFWIQRGATWLTRDKPRPFALATDCTAGRTGILAYGSTSKAEQTMGAVCIEVAPLQAGINRNGLRARTWFYPGILLRRPYEQLPPHLGGLGNGLYDLRSALYDALGIGRGSCMRGDAPVHSRRGRIVELQRWMVAYLRTRYAVLLTAPEYSRAKNYHVVLPIRRGDGFVTSEGVLRIESVEWFAAFDEQMDSVLLPIPVIQSLWYETAIARETEHVVDEDSLARIDRALCDYFSLPAPEEQG